MLTGIASIPGPPVIFYWMASDLPGKAIRANLLAFFLLGDFLSIVSFWIADLFTPSVLGIGIAAMPFYFASLLVGSKLHGMASDATYRRVTFVLIVLSRYTGSADPVALPRPSTRPPDCELRGAARTQPRAKAVLSRLI